MYHHRFYSSSIPRVNLLRKHKLYRVYTNIYLLWVNKNSQKQKPIKSEIGVRERMQMLITPQLRTVYIYMYICPNSDAYIHLFFFSKNKSIFTQLYLLKWIFFLFVHAYEYCCFVHYLYEYNTYIFHSFIASYFYFLFYLIIFLWTFLHSLYEIYF